MTVTVFRYLILISIDFYDFIFSVFSLVLVSIEKIYQTLTTVFDHISIHLKVRQKYSSTRRIFNSLLGVFGNVVKHSPSCLTYYINVSTTKIFNQNILEILLPMYSTKII